LKIKWDEDIFLEGAKAYYDYSLKHSKKRVLGWIFIALLQFGIVMLLKQGTYGMVLLGSILTLYWYFLRWPIRRLLLKMAFKKSPLANKEMNIDINKNGLLIDNQELPFEKIKDFIKGNKGYLLLIDKGFIYLPFNKLSKDEKDIFLKVKK